jgi:hypothetical protein
MKVGDINKKLTAKALNESLAKRFGTKIDIDKFTLEQLQDARNKIRTKVFNVETTESFNSVQKQDYQKNKLFLDVLNAAIIEREHISERAESKAKQQASGAALAVKRGDKPRSSLQGASKEMINMSAAELEKIASTKHKGLPQKADEGAYGKKKRRKVDEIGVVNNQARQALLQALQVFRQSEPEKARALEQFMNQIGYTPASNRGPQTGNLPAMNLGDSVIREGAEDKAELVMAAKDMVDRLTGWMEDTAEMQTESMLELADAIRDEMGVEQSGQFVDTVKPALEQLYSAMEVTRVALTSGVGMLTGEEMPVDTMGAEPPPAGEEPLPPLDGETPPLEPPVDDNFGAAPAAAGGAEEAGRARRESIERKRKMLETSRMLGSILSKKK